MRDAAFSIRIGSEMVIVGNKFDPYWKYTVSDNNRFMNPVFDDSYDYMQSESYELDGVECGVNIPNYGLKIFVTDESYDRSTAKIHIGINGSSSVQEQTIVQQILFAEDEINIITDKEYGSKAYAKLVGENGETMEAELDWVNDMYKTKSDLLIDGINWQISFLVFEDKEGNAKAIYNSNIHGVYGIDFNNITSRKTIVRLSGITINSKVYDKKPIAVQGQTYAYDSVTGDRIAIDNFEYIWLDKMGNKLESAPINAGNYNLKVSAVDEKYFGISIIPFVIEKRDAIIKAEDISIDLNEALPSNFTLQYDNVLPGDEVLLLSGTPEYQLQRSDNALLTNSALEGQYYIQITNLNDIITENANYNVRTEFGYGLLLIGNIKYPLNVEVSGISIDGKRIKDYDKKTILYTGKPIAKIGNKQINIKGFNIKWYEKTDIGSTVINGSPIDAGNYVLNVSVEDERYTGFSTLTATIHPKNVQLWIRDYGMNQGDVLPNDRALEIYFKDIIAGDEKLLLNASCQPKFFFIDDNWDILLSSERAGRYTIRLKNFKELIKPNKNYIVSEQSGSLYIYGDNTVFDEKEQVRISGVEVNYENIYNGTSVNYTGTPYVELNGEKLNIELQIIWHNKTTHDILTSAPSDYGDYELIILVPENDSKYVGKLKIPFRISKAGIQVKIKSKTVIQGSKLPNKFEYYYRNESTGDYFYNSSILEAGIPEFNIYKKLGDKLGKQVFDTSIPGEYYVRIANFGNLSFNTNYNARITEDEYSWGILTIEPNIGQPMLPDIDENKTKVIISGISVLDKIYDEKANEIIGSIIAKTNNDEDVTSSINFVTVWRVAGEDSLFVKPPIDVGNYELVIYVPENDATYTGNTIIPFIITPKPLKLSIKATAAIAQGDPIPLFELFYNDINGNEMPTDVLPLRGSALFEVRKDLGNGNLGNPISDTYSAVPGEYVVLITNFNQIKPVDANYAVTSTAGSIIINETLKNFVTVEGVSINNTKVYDSNAIVFTNNNPIVKLRGTETEVNVDDIKYIWTNLTSGTSVEGMNNAPKDAGRYKLIVSVIDDAYTGSSEAIGFNIEPKGLKVWANLDVETNSIIIIKGYELPNVSDIIKLVGICDGDTVRIKDHKAVLKSQKSNEIITNIDQINTTGNYDYVLSANRPDGLDTIEISNPNYKINGDIWIYIGFKSKPEVIINGISIDDKVYDGKVIIYNSLGLKITDKSNNNDLTSSLSSELEYKWYKNDDTPLITAPKDAGDYYLEVSIKKSNPNYIGNKKFYFTINQANAKAKSRRTVVESVEKLPDSIELVYSGIINEDLNKLPKYLLNDEFDIVFDNLDGSSTSASAITAKIVINDTGKNKINSSVYSNYRISFEDGVIIVTNGAEDPGKSEATIEISDVLSKVYDGKSVTVNPVVKFNGDDITNQIFGLEYIWQDKDGNQLAQSPSDAGEYKLTISILNESDYTGSTTISFAISKKKVKLSLYGIRLDGMENWYTVEVRKGDPIPDFKLCLVDIDNSQGFDIIRGIEISGIPVFKVMKPGSYTEELTDTNVEFSPSEQIKDCSVILYNMNDISITSKNYELDKTTGFNGWLRIYKN